MVNPASTLSCACGHGRTWHRHDTRRTDTVCAAYVHADVPTSWGGSVRVGSPCDCGRWRWRWTHPLDWWHARHGRAASVTMPTPRLPATGQFPRSR